MLLQVSPCYPKETANFPSHISALLLESYATLSAETRKTLVQNLVMLRNKNVITSVEWVSHTFFSLNRRNSFVSLLKTLFPLLPRVSSSSLRSFIRRTILSDIRTANQRTKNHKLNRAVQAMLFGMIERGMDGEVAGDKGKHRAKPGTAPEGTGRQGEEAMWAVVVTKELWKKGVWSVAFLLSQHLSPNSL
jgi:protein SDA1